MKFKKLKLFIWDNVLQDYTAGIMFALAPDVETAREMILEECDFVPDHELEQEPKVYNKPTARVVWGGG